MQTKQFWSVLKQYWFLVGALSTGLCTAVGWVIGANGRMFSSPEEKVRIVTKVDEGLTPEQVQRAYFMDSLEKASAIKAREKRLKTDLTRDSIRGVQDSIMMDLVQKNAIQIFQIKEEIKKINP